MKLHLFIASRLAKNARGTFTNTINKIAVVTISLGLSSMIISVMVLNGFQKEIKNKVYKFAGHMTISKYQLSSSEKSPINTHSYFDQKIKEYRFIQSIDKVAYKAGLLKANDEVQGIIVKGLEKDYDIEKYNGIINQGRFIDIPEDDYSKEAVISESIAKNLRLKLEDEVLIFFLQDPPRYRKLKVVGLFNSGMHEFDERFILTDIGLIQRINNWPDSLIGGYEIYLEKNYPINKAYDQIFEDLDYDLYIQKISDRYLQIFDWLSLLDRNLLILLTLILIVASFSMVSILLILIMERTQMIGIFKTIGAADGLLRKIFFFNGLQLILRGLIIGNGLALLLGWIQKRFKVIPLDPANYYMESVPIDFDLFWIIFINLITLLIIGLTLFIPLSIISRINPIKVIRFD
ncbi:MAG TPA: ABC transporter permease [Cyclobacteriaceae bacterium]